MVQGLDETGDDRAAGAGGWVLLVRLLDRAQDFVMMTPTRGRQFVVGVADAVGESVAALRR